MTPNLSGVAETLLIPVRARAYESGRPDALLQDPWAIHLLEQLALAPSSKDELSAATLIGTVLRTLSFDQKITAFMDAYPEGVVVNLGCGLDARYHRLCPASVRWFDLDVAESMTLRKQFFEEKPNYKMLTGSMFDDAWRQQVPKNTPILIFFEGVSMYFPEAQLRPWLLSLFHEFTQADVVFDVLSKALANNTQRHPDVKKYQAPFKWGLNAAVELRQWAPEMIVVADESYMGKPPLYRWPLSIRLLKWLPAVQRMCRVIHLRYEP
ncbi:MAG: class I SAM-dependent methyltransferase [Neisseriaceae bacterium]|nr:class I SAM-dependent methyltransferase [Neisseriaceae bacterium]